eukprot:s2908_g10.t1
MLSVPDLYRTLWVLRSSWWDQEELEEVEDAKKRPPVAFVFPGQGSQYLGMARGLYDQVPHFQRMADHCCEQLAMPKLLGRDLRPLLFGDALMTEDELQQDRGGFHKWGYSSSWMEFEKPSVMQPALFVVEYALAQTLLAVDVKPVACAGHSLGEYAAAVLGGYLTLEAALQIVAARAKSTETLAEEGAMLSVADWTSEDLEAVANGQRKGLWLAAVNSPQHSVISGEVAAIEDLEKELKAAGYDGGDRGPGGCAPYGYGLERPCNGSLLPQIWLFCHTAFHWQRSFSFLAMRINLLTVAGETEVVEIETGRISELTGEPRRQKILGWKNGGQKRTCA